MCPGIPRRGRMMIRPYPYNSPSKLEGVAAAGGRGRVSNVRTLHTPPSALRASTSPNLGEELRYHNLQLCTNMVPYPSRAFVFPYRSPTTPLECPWRCLFAPFSLPHWKHGTYNTFCLAGGKLCGGVGILLGFKLYFCSRNNENNNKERRTI